MSYRKEWDAFTLYLEEHPGAFDKQERLGIKWADLEIKRLREIEARAKDRTALYSCINRDGSVERLTAITQRYLLEGKK